MPRRAGLALVESPRDARARAPWFVDTTMLLAYDGSPAARARQLYRDHMKRGDKDEPATHPLVAGDDAFVASMISRVLPEPSTPRRYLQRPRPPLETLVDAKSADAAAIAAAHARGYSLREIARHLGVNASTVSRRLARQPRARLQA